MAATAEAPARGRARRLLAAGPVGVAELALAGLAMLVLGGAMWGSHVFDGGFYWADDWYHARLYLLPDGTGILRTLNPHTSQFRPVLGLLLAAPYRVFGLQTELHLALAIVLAAGASAAFYWLLRTLGLERLHAGLMAGLVLLFPWSDSSRLWTTASINNFALIFSFVGLVAALHALRASGRRAVVLTVVSLGLYVAATLTYEVVAGALLLSGLVYAWWAGWRAAVRRWPLDLVAVGAAVVYILRRQPDHHTNSPGPRDQAEHAWKITHQAADLLLSAAVPVGGVPGAAVAVLLGAIVLGALAAWRRLPAGDPAGAELWRWLRIGAVGVAGIAAGYAPFVPGLLKYIPAAPGILNRVNLLAAFGFVVVVYALAMLAGTLLARALGRPPTVVAAACAALASVAIGAGYADRAAQDKADWAHGWEVEQLVLATIRNTVPDPPRRARIYTFGAPNYVAPGVPAFALAGDLRNAVQVEFRERGLQGYPMRPSTRWVCGPDRMHPTDYYFGPPEGTAYGRGVFVSIPLAQGVVIADQAACRRWSARFGHPPVS